MALIDGLKTLYNSIFLNNDLLISRLRKLGVAIGDDVTFYCPKEMTVDIQNPHLITIGDHVKITGPSTILTHDYSWGVIKGKTGEVFGNQKHVTIGNNVFIGWSCHNLVRHDHRGQRDRRSALRRQREARARFCLCRRSRKEGLLIRALP